MTEKTLDGALAEVVSSLKTAVETHGNNAVDLALWAVQLNAIEHVATCAIVFAVSVAVFIWCWPKILAEADKGNPLPAVVVAVSVPAAVVSFFEITRFSQWMAAFGAPEVLIAEKALRTAGLL